MIPTIYDVSPRYVKHFLAHDHIARFWAPRDEQILVWSALVNIRQSDALLCVPYSAGVSQAGLARQFGISYQRVYQIVHGRRR